MKKKLEIGQKSKVNIKWNVKPIDRSDAAEKEIINSFSQKYGIPKDNITVEPVYIAKNDNGESVRLTNDMIGNIQDPKFQQELFKEYLSDNDINDYDFDKIVEIDESINALIDYENYDKRKRYTIKWVKWSNFMSYGPDNFFDFRTLDGLVLLTSEPANQGGKSTFCLDLLRFLLFGKVTSRESDWTLAKVFNKHLPEATEVSVEGCIEIDGCDYVIKRVVTRPSLAKRSDKSKVSQKISYYKIVNNEYVDLYDEEDVSEKDGRATNTAIKEAIGNERDFDLMICVNDANLKGLISLKDTERGRLITRWIGLLPLEEKDKLAREKYNTSVSKSLLSSRYTKSDVIEKNESLKKDNKEYADYAKELEKKVKANDKQLEKAAKERDKLLQSKTKIDDNLSNIDITTIERKLSEITEEGKLKRAELNEKKEKMKEFDGLTFNESDYNILEQRCTSLSTDIAKLREQAKNAKGQIEALKKGEFCPTCGAKLKNVDNTEAIKRQERIYDDTVKEGTRVSSELKAETAKKDEMAKKRSQYNEKVRTQLIIDKLSVDIENLTARYRECKKLLSDFEANKTAIKKNGEIDASINVIDENIKVLTKTNNEYREQIAANKNTISLNEKSIKENEEIIKVLDKEEVLIKNWKIYLEMIGKNGISKMVLRRALPFINGEIKRLLNGVCDFEVEVVIDNHNDVEFNLIHNGVVSSLASGSGYEQTVSSLALRSVLGKVSSFSKPSFVVFDEILGGVADENYDNVKALYDKIVVDYAFILQISHLKSLFEWHDHFIKIKKENDISVIEAA